MICRNPSITMRRCVCIMCFFPPRSFTNSPRKLITRRTLYGDNVNTVYTDYVQYQLRALRNANVLRMV